MFLQFLGTRGEIDNGTPRHGRHSALLIVSGSNRIMIDCGLDWREELPRLRPHAILLTHAHPDHASGVQDGAPCTVYATAETHKQTSSYRIVQRETIKPRSSFEIDEVLIEAVSVDHSARCPAVGYRITCSGATIFYCPVVANIPDVAAAFKDLTLYIGDGASVDRGLLRKKGKKVFGHAAMRTQLEWCGKHGVPRAMFTRCGREVVSADGRAAARQLRRLGWEQRVSAKFAYDGLQLAISARL